MMLPLLSSAKASLEASLLGRYIGTPSKKNKNEGLREADSLPQLKFKLGEEPTTPRTGSPAFQDGHWVIARPNLATPIIYQHARSPANDHSSLGLGATLTQSGTPSSPEQNSEAGGYGGAVHAWGEDGDDVDVQTQELEVHGEDQHLEHDQPRCVDNPALDHVDTYVNDLYLATARPRFDPNPICLRRQRENASVAAGALINSLGGVDRWTNQPAKPTDKVGDQRAESLEFGARMLIKSLDGEFPAPMRSRAAEALQKALTFQDVRARVADVTPLAIAPLVELLRQGPSTSGHGGSGGQVQNEGVGKLADGVGRSRERRPGEEEDNREIMWGQESKAPLRAAACLRVMALSKGLPETMVSASAIPSLVDGLRSGSDVMKSICGGCLASMALCDEESCSEMIDFGVMSPLLALARAGNSLHELTAWGALATIMRIREAREVFARVDGFADLEGMLVRKRNTAGAHPFLAPCQESAMRVLVWLCEEDEDSDADSQHGIFVPAVPPHSSGRNDRKAGRRKKVEESAEGEGGAETDPPHLMAVEFISQEAVFRSILRQMRIGTLVSVEAAVQVLIRAWKACSRRQVDATIPYVLAMLASDVWMLKSAAAQVILHVYIEDDQRLACAKAGGVDALIDMLRIKAQQMQAGTLAALLSLCEHPDVPGLVVGAGGLALLAEYLTTSRDVAQRYVVLTLLKIALVCERSSVEPFLPDMLVSEHVLGASDEVESFVQTFVDKRKAADYLLVGANNLRRFELGDITVYKETFKKLDNDASGALDEQELKKLLKQLKVDHKKKNVRRVLEAVDKNKSGTVEFDEFLDIMWDVKHAKGKARGALLRSAGVLLEDTVAAAQAVLKRQRKTLQHKETPASSAGPLLLLQDDTDQTPKKLDQSQSGEPPTTTTAVAPGVTKQAEDTEPATELSPPQRKMPGTGVFHVFRSLGRTG